MQIKSMAGEFSVSIERFEVENNQLVLVGKMGVWEARTYIEPGELFGTLSKAVRSAALWSYILRAPFLIVAKRAGKSGEPK